LPFVIMWPGRAGKGAVMNRTIWLFGLLWIAQLARGDLIHLRDGSVLEGKVVRQTAEQVEVLFVAVGGEMRVTYPVAKIERIELKKTPDELLREEYHARSEKLSPENAAGWAELGEWCSKQPMLKAEARDAFRKALAIDPDNETARKALCFVKYRDMWMTEAEAMGAQGYVQHDGRWITFDHYREIVEAERRAEADRREQELNDNLAKVQATADEAQRKLREAEDKLDEMAGRIRDLERTEPTTIIIQQQNALPRMPLWWWRRHHPDLLDKHDRDKDDPQDDETPKPAGSARAGKPRPPW